MFSFKRQPQSIWGVIADGFRLYRASISRVWYWQILFILPAALFGAVDTWLNPNADLPFSVGYISFLVAATILVIVVSIVGHCFTFSRIHAVGAQGDVSIRASMRRAIKKVWPVFAAALVFLILMLIMLVPIFLLFSMVRSVELAFLGMYFMFTLLIVISILFMLFPFFILFENSSIFSSLKKSVTHMWGNFWRTLTMLVLLSFMGMAIFFALLLPLKLLTDFGGSAALLLFSVIGLFLVYIAIYTLIVPMFNAMLLVLFHDVKERKVVAEQSAQAEH